MRQTNSQQPKQREINTRIYVGATKKKTRTKTKRHKQRPKSTLGERKGNRKQEQDKYNMVGHGSTNVQRYVYSLNSDIRLRVPDHNEPACRNRTAVRYFSMHSVVRFLSR